MKGWTSIALALLFTAGAAVIWMTRRTVAPGSGATDGLRLVSLSPAISRTLVDLGVADRVVGRTPWCRSLDPSIPVAGDLLDLDTERLIRLEPTHVLVQPPAAGVSPALDELAALRGWTIGAWRLDDLDDVAAMIRGVAETLAAADVPAVEAEAIRRRAGELQRALAAARAPPAPGAAPVFRAPVLLVADTEPVLVYGRGTYLHDLLVAQGGRNATDARGWAELSLEDVARIDPAAIILVRDGRIAVLAHPDVELPSSGVIGVGAALRDALRTLAGPAP